MKITSYEFEDYRIFKKRSSIKLRPLTVFFGYNNVGKSAALRCLPFLAGSMSASRENTFQRSIFNYSLPVTRKAVFEDIAHNGSSNMAFSLTWEDGDKLDFQVKKLGSSSEYFGNYHFSHSIAGERKNLSVDYELDDDTFQNAIAQIDELQIEVTFNGFQVSERNKPETANMSLQSLNVKLADFNNAVHWLSPIRARPERFFELGPHVIAQIQHDGSGIGPTLMRLADSESEALKVVNQWLEKTCSRVLDTSQSMRQAVQGRNFASLITRLSGDLDIRSQISILDAGEGIIQALPAVALCAQARVGDLGTTPIIALEQPELHLHPKATVDLAHLIVENVALNRNVTHVLETHSESFVLAFQIALARGTLHPDDFACYWVEASPDRSFSILREVIFDAQGYAIEGWPHGVFRETLDQARTLSEFRISGGK